MASSANECRIRIAAPRSLLRLRLALAQIILAGAHARAGRGAVRIEGVLGDGDHPAVLAHLEHLEPAVGAREHPVFARELGRDTFDRALRSERLAAADAAERFLLFEHARGGAGGAEVKLWGEPDHLLRAGRLAQA